MDTDSQTKTGLFRLVAAMSVDIKPNFQFSEVKDIKVQCAPYTDLQSITYWPEESQGYFWTVMLDRQEKQIHIYYAGHHI